MELISSICFWVPDEVYRFSEASTFVLSMIKLDPDCVFYGLWINISCTVLLIHRYFPIFSFASGVIEVISSFPIHETYGQSILFHYVFISKIMPYSILKPPGINTTRNTRCISLTSNIMTKIKVRISTFVMGMISRS